MFYSEFHKGSIPYGIPFKKCDSVRISHEFGVKNDVQMEVPYGIPLGFHMNSIWNAEFHMEFHLDSKFFCMKGCFLQ